MRPDPNYLADRNPFQLAKPPTWWLRGMYSFDPDLVLVPSRCKPVFVLARRRRLSRALGAILDRKLRIDDPQHTSNTALCDAYHLVAVTTIFVQGAWTTGNLQAMLDELRRRDTWTHGRPLDEAGQRAAVFEGGSQLAKDVDAHDERNRARINQQEREACYHATGDAWRSRQARTGSRVLNAGSPTPRRGVIATPAPMPVPRGRLIGV
jgi:hypothetical protein